jgi:hypothetical protein
MPATMKEAKLYSRAIAREERGSSALQTPSPRFSLFLSHPPPLHLGLLPSRSRHVSSRVRFFFFRCLGPVKEGTKFAWPARRRHTLYVQENSDDRTSITVI